MESSSQVVQAHAGLEVGILVLKVDVGRRKQVSGSDDQEEQGHQDLSGQ